MKLHLPLTNISRNFVTHCVVTFIALSAFWPSAQAAYCSLRDPISAIHYLYPEADRHRSIVRTITRETRTRMSESLPFTLHFNELGKHTLYVAQQQNLPLGFIHARSELSDSGLIEIVWAISPNLKIDGFAFQRCRSSACNDEFIEKMSVLLRGKTMDEILPLLASDGNALAPTTPEHHQQNQDLALSVIRSALKTLAATEYEWSEDIAEIRRLAIATRWLDNNVKSELLAVPSSELEIIKIPAATAPVYAFIDQPSIRVFRVMVEDKEVARLVDADWRLENQSGKFSWLFSKQGEVLAIENHDPLPDQNAKVAFSQLLGQDLASGKSCTSAAELAGNNLFLNAYNQVEVVSHEN